MRTENKHFFVLLCALLVQVASTAGTLKMSQSTLLDKIKGGWAGKTIACAYGGPTEFCYNGRYIPDSVPLGLTKDYLVKQIPGGLYDDVYMNLTFVDVFANYGLDAPIDSFAMAFANAKYPLWHANQAARFNILNGIKAPASGNWKYNPHADDIDFQIEADFAGFMSPAMPKSALKYTDKIGHIMNYGDGWYGGVFVATMGSLAFEFDDVQVIVKKALQAIPKKSWFYKVIDTVIKTHATNPDNWKVTWQAVQDLCAPRKRCMTDMGGPFDINATINSAYIAIGLLYGNGDFDKTMEIATRCGQDSDCNPSSAAGVLGVMKGYSNIPKQWTDMLSEAENMAFAYKDYSLNKTYAASIKQAMQTIRRNGGKVKGENITIKTQNIKRARFEESFPGITDIKEVAINVTLNTENTEWNGTFEGNGIALLGDPQGNNDYVAEFEITLDGVVLDKAYRPVLHRTRSQHIVYQTELKSPETHQINIKWLNPQKDTKVYLSKYTRFTTK